MTSPNTLNTKPAFLTWVILLDVNQGIRIKVEETQNRVHMTRIVSGVYHQHITMLITATIHISMQFWVYMYIVALSLVLSCNVTGTHYSAVLRYPAVIICLGV